MSFPNIFEIRGCMLIDMLLFLRFLEPCLNAAAMFGNLKQLRKFNDLIAPFYQR